MACTIPTTISASLETVLTKCGKVLLLERRGDVEAGDIYIEWNAKVRS